MLLLVFSVRLGWLPASARSEYGLKGLVLPVACLLIVTVGYVTRMVRASVVATMHRPFIRTARLKGLTTPQLVRRHVLRNSLVVPVTTLGVQLRYLVGGLVTVELLFNHAGIGSLLLTAAREKDVPTLQAATLVTGVFVVGTFLLADICYALLDPGSRRGGDVTSGSRARARSSPVLGHRCTTRGRPVARSSAAVTLAPVEAAARHRRPRSTSRLAVGRVPAACCRRSPASCSAWVVAAIAWPWLAPVRSERPGPGRRLRRAGRATTSSAPTGFGRDVLSRVLAGAREVLVIAPLAVAIAVVVGTAIGLAIGYRGGFPDTVAMRGLEAIAVLPPLFPVVLAAALLGSSNAVLVVVIAFAFTPLVTWTVRSATLVEREKQYVEAARLRGERGVYIATREILPNITAPITVEATVRLADAIFAIATLSFIGLGAPPGSPDWGAQVAENRVYVQHAWWTVLFPALAVASLVIAVSLLADAIREHRR